VGWRDGRVQSRLTGGIVASYPVVAAEGAKKQDFSWYVVWLRDIFLP